jgi:hypothetical protein
MTARGEVKSKFFQALLSGQPHTGMPYCPIFNAKPDFRPFCLLRVALFALFLANMQIYIKKLEKQAKIQNFAPAGLFFLARWPLKSNIKIFPAGQKKI